MPLASAGGFLLLVNLTDERFCDMGTGPMITIAVLDENGVPVPVSPDNPIPTQAGN